LNTEYANTDILRWYKVLFFAPSTADLHAGFLQLRHDIVGSLATMRSHSELTPIDMELWKIPFRTPTARQKTREQMSAWHRGYW
jgi:hypothetical protein